MAVFIMPVNTACDIGYGLLNCLTGSLGETDFTGCLQMGTSRNRLLATIAFLCAAVALQTAHAEQPNETTRVSGLLAARLPNVDREQLVDLARSMRSQLILRKQKLVQAVEDSEFEGGDAVLAAFLPSCLLYAGFQKARHAQAMEELAQINVAIDEYSNDILAMQPGPASIAVAQLR